MSGVRAGRVRCMTRYTALRDVARNSVNLHLNIIVHDRDIGVFPKLKPAQI